jgi:hypothetical protein
MWCAREDSRESRCRESSIDINLIYSDHKRAAHPKKEETQTHRLETKWDLNPGTDETNLGRLEWKCT